MVAKQAVARHERWSGSAPRRVDVSLDHGLLHAIDEEAKQRGMTRSAFLSSAARNEIEGRR